MHGVSGISYVYNPFEQSSSEGRECPRNGAVHVHLHLHLIDIVPGPFPEAEWLDSTEASREIVNLFVRTYGNGVASRQLWQVFEGEEEEKKRAAQLVTKFEGQFEELERAHSMRMKEGDFEEIESLPRERALELLEVLSRVP